MIIPVLASLCNREQWIAFCRRERPYCYVREPDTLVDMQSTFLIITLLNGDVRDGREATKFSIGTRSSLEPAWQFIKACRFDLEYMVDGLQRVRFDGNARDNSGFRAADNVSIRRYFSKEAAIISPAAIGPLEPLQRLPAHWNQLAFCQLLANKQFSDLRSEHQLAAPGDTGKPSTLDAELLLRRLIRDPEGWEVTTNEHRVELARNGAVLVSLQPDLKLDRLRRAPII